LENKTLNKSILAILLLNGGNPCTIMLAQTSQITLACLSSLTYTRE